MAESNWKRYKDFLWPLGGTVLGIPAIPIWITQYPMFINENEWILPASVASVLLCWIVPLLLHHRTRRIYSRVAAIPKYGYSLFTIVCVAGIAILSFGGWSLFRFHTRHLRESIASLTRPHIVEQLPGFAAHLVIKLIDDANSQRQYIFDLGDREGSRASFYISASNHFTFSLTDTHGETYLLEVEIGKTGISLGEFSYIVCEVGATTRETTVAVLVNGREVAYRTIRGSIDLGSRKWNNGNIGASQQGNSNGSFVLAEMMVYSNT